MTSMSSNNGPPQYTTDSIIGDYQVLMEGSPTQQLKKYLEPYTKDELQSLIMSLATNDEPICQAILAKIKTDKKWCKLFVHGLAFSTSKETLENHYKHYGKVKEAVVLVDKKGNSKGYGFVTFENAKFALEAAKDPKKRIDNRVTHCNLAFKGNPKKFAGIGSSGNASSGLSPKQRENANDRRLFVHSLAWKTDDDSLAQVFQKYGELQEAVVIRDKKTGKSKGYGFVTFKYSESAQSALHEPNKKIDGRQTHCNYACERSNINTGGGNSGDQSINSPNSTINDSRNLTSPNSMTMNLQQQNSNASNNSGHPNLTFSNPLALNPGISANSSNSIHNNTLHNNALHNNTMHNNTIHNNTIQRTNPFTNIHNQQLGSGIAISNYQRPLIGASPQQQRQTYNPSYPYGSSSHNMDPNRPPHGGRQTNDFSHLISPNQHDPTVSLLRNMQQPQSPIPPIMGLNMLRNMTQGSGNPGFPSHLQLGGHGHNHQQSSNGGIVVSGVHQNNLFTSPMPPSAPAPPTPPYTHVQTSNKDHLSNNQSSPYYGGQPSTLSIPGFKPQITTLDQINNPYHPTQQPSTKKIIATGIGNQILSLQQQLHNSNKSLPPTIIPSNNSNNPLPPSNNVNIKMNITEKKIPPNVKVPNIQPPQHHNEGNLTPKSQCGSDDEGEDDAVKK